MKKIYLLILYYSFINTNQMSAQFTNVMIDNLSDAEEPSIAINPLNTNIIAAGSNIQNAYHSTDGGATWLKDFLNTTLTAAGDPCLIADSSGNFYYFHLTNAIDRIVCQKSTDGGATYNNGSFAINSTILFEDKEWAAVDPHSNNLYVTWTEYDNGFSPGSQDSSRIYFSKSVDSGATFSNGVRLNSIAGDCLYLDITDPHPFVGIHGEIYVTFMDSSGIRLNKSLDTGNTWLSTQPLIAAVSTRYNSVSGVSRIRSMPYSICDRSNSLYRGNLYVSWSDQRNGANNSDIFFIKSVDNGNNWTSPMKVNTDNSNVQQYRNAMTVDQTNGYIYIVYYDRRNYSGNDTTDIYLSKSIDGGDNWIDFRISNSGFYSDGSVFEGDYIDIAAHAGIVRPIWTRIDNFSSGVWTCLYDESTVGIPSVKNPLINFTVNPNPANNVIVVSLTHSIEKLDGTITDASGRIILNFEMKDESEKIIDIQNLPSGIYFIKAGTMTRKLIVEK